MLIEKMEITITLKTPDKTVTYTEQLEQRFLAYDRPAFHLLCIMERFLKANAFTFSLSGVDGIVAGYLRAEKNANETKG